MTNKEKAMLILEELDNAINVNWAFEEFYINAIVKALKKIEEEQKD